MGQVFQIVSNSSPQAFEESTSIEECKHMLESDNFNIIETYWSIRNSLDTGLTIPSGMNALDFLHLQIVKLDLLAQKDPTLRDQDMTLTIKIDE